MGVPCAEQQLQLQKDPAKSTRKVEAGVHGICGEAEKDGFVQPGEQKAEMGSYVCLELPRGRERSRWSQAPQGTVSCFGPFIARNRLEQVWRPVEATRQVGILELRTCQENWRELDLLHLEKKRHKRGPVADSSHLMGGHREHRARFFKDVHDGGMRSNGSKLEHGNSS